MDNYNIIFTGERHQQFFEESMCLCRDIDVYHMALIYCLGISNDTRERIDSIYDFKSGDIRTECLKEGWITSGSARVIRLAFNLYTNGAQAYWRKRKRKRMRSAGLRSVVTIWWMNCSAAGMQNIFGRQFKFVIRNIVCRRGDIR